MSGKTFTCWLIGEGPLLVKCGEIIQENGHRILGVVAENQFIRDWCLKHGILCINPKDNYAEKVSSCSFDYLFSIVNLSILSKKVLALPSKAAINFHDSLLPSYSGIHATSWALLNREKVHGVTWHIMTEKIDMGGIIKQKQVDIDPCETAFTLNLKCLQAGIESFKELVGELVSGSLITAKLKNYLDLIMIVPVAWGIFSGLFVMRVVLGS